ncbi:MAG: hypothetical protein K0Q43_1805 [Ramlibacter sp.]|jgi:hypothetical protein|nr:hypothetical protein [Ramlibacter sp.]
MDNLKNCCNALSRAFTPRPARSELGDNNAGGDAPDALSLPPAPVRVHSAPLLVLTSLASPPDEPGERDPLVIHAAHPRPDDSQAPQSIVATHRQNRFVQLAMLKDLLKHLQTFLPGRDALILRSTWRGAPRHMPRPADIARAASLLQPIASAQNRLVEARKAHETADCGWFFKEMRALVKPFEKYKVVKEEAQLCRTFLDLAEKVERGTPLTQQEKAKWAEVCKKSDWKDGQRIGQRECRVSAEPHLLMLAERGTAVKGSHERDDFLAAVKTVLAGIYRAGRNNGMGRLHARTATNDGYGAWKVEFGREVERSRLTPEDRSGLVAARKSVTNAQNKIDPDALGFLLGMGFAGADQENLVKCEGWLRNLQESEGKEIEYVEVERVMREMNMPAHQVNRVHVAFQTLLAPNLPVAKRLEILESLNRDFSTLRDEILLVAGFSLARMSRSSSPPSADGAEVTHRRIFNGVEQRHTHGGPDPHVHRFLFRDADGRIAHVHIHAFNDASAPAGDS